MSSTLYCQKQKHIWHFLEVAMPLRPAQDSVLNCLRIDGRAT
jgi:hypothetical protein